MQPKDRLTHGYDLDAIAGAAFRARETGAAVDSLPSIFERGATPLPINRHIDTLTRLYLSRLTAKMAITDNMQFQASRAYDSFSENGIDYESRVYR